MCRGEGGHEAVAFVLDLVEVVPKASGGVVDDGAVLAQLDDRRLLVALRLFGGTLQIGEENGNGDAVAIADARRVSRKRLLSLCGCVAASTTAERNSQGGLH